MTDRRAKFEQLLDAALRDELPTIDSIYRACELMRQRGNTHSAVFLCAGAARRKTLHVVDPESLEFDEMSEKDYYELVGIYGPGTKPKQLRDDIFSQET